MREQLKNPLSQSHTAGGLGGVLANVDYSYLTPSVNNLQGNNTENQHLQ